MAILNVTPDSFSDGCDLNTAGFIEKAETLIADGADILDVGGESTRPQAPSVSLAEERARVLPFIKAFRVKYPHFPISLDTKKYELAREVCVYDIQIINDVSFLSDERLVDLAIEYNLAYVLMHARGDSTTMGELTDYSQGLVATMQTEFDEKIKKICDLGLAREQLILDLGFGFAKTPKQCVSLMENLAHWKSYQLPLLLGLSRKRFLQEYTGQNRPAERDKIAADLSRQAYQQGFQIIRTHNVRLTKEACT